MANIDFKLKLLILSTLLLKSSVSLAYDDECRQWFIAAKIKNGPDCLIECVTSKVDMGSFSCPERCSYLCGERPDTMFFFKVSDLYGLTNSERAIVAKDPRRALKAYQLSLKAENLCARIYKQSLANDESDACRHFVWAALLTRDLDPEFVTSVLNAHEDQVDQKQTERAMDLANNRLGQISVHSLKDRSDTAILDSFRSNLKKKAFVIIKPRAPKNEVEKP